MTVGRLVLRAEGIARAYPDPRRPERRRPVLADVGLTLAPGCSLGITGASGAGKSTLGRILALRQRADAGRLTVNGDVVDLARARAPRRPLPIQYLPQAVGRSFHPQRRVGRALEELVRCRSARRDGRERLSRRLAAWLERMELPSGCLERLPGRLSGGELQRLAIVRTLLVEPRILILDEPSSALDLLARDQLARLLRGLRETEGLGLLVFTHDLAFARVVCDELRELREGRLVSPSPG